MDGFNASIIAYGPSGSGKTHTMVRVRGSDTMVTPQSLCMCPVGGGKHSLSVAVCSVQCPVLSEPYHKEVLNLYITMDSIVCCKPS